MYGFNPNARIEKLAKVPPEKMSRRENKAFPEKRAASEVRSTPAAGT
jgi:hypothetical protein